MNPSKFDAIVKARAQQRVEQRANRFREAIASAFRDLYKDIPTKASPLAHPHYPNERLGTYLRESVVLDIVKSLCHKEGETHPSLTLPREFWTYEEAEVSKALLSVMDEMQKALCAPVNANRDVIPSEDKQTPTS